MTDPSRLTALATHKYVRLTTFRRDGTPVPTPVWLVRDGDGLQVITDGSTGKVKRIRHTPRVLIAPSDARGRVKQGVADVEALAEIISDPPEVRRVRELVKARYGFGYQVAMFVQRLRGMSFDNGVALRIRTTP